jgi:anaerobic selenocysteine-containing dehydrogenase
MSADWKPTCCTICSLNCGLEVQVEDGHIVRTRADKAHPVSRGYLCEKSQRMDQYQNGRDRLSSPMRRRADGSYEAIPWDTAIREVAARLAAVRDEHGGASILYYGGGAQANHMPAVYAQSTLHALGVRYRSNALAQEKTGEAWVQARMFGCGMHADIEHAEVTLLIGKNPWQSHGFPRARLVLREIQADPARSLIVIDPRRSETAQMADFHLALKPGTDAWCLAALAAVLVQEGLVADAWLAAHATGLDPVIAALKQVPISDYARVCELDEGLIRAAARRMAAAFTLASLEDLGMQMGIHSTLGSYLHRLIFLLAGHYGGKGQNFAFVPLRPLGGGGHGGPRPSAKDCERNWRRSPVTGFPVVMGLIPCNAISEEILTDHPHRFRAMLIESSNPVHSLAESQRMREALGVLTPEMVAPLAAAAAQGLEAFTLAFGQAVMADPSLMSVASVLLYRALGPALPDGMANAAGLFGISQLYVQSFPAPAARAGFEGPLAGTMLFRAMLDNPSGIVFAKASERQSFEMLRQAGGQINLAIPEMLEALDSLGLDGPPRDADFPYVLSAGERRTETSNTNIRDAGWLRKGELESSLRVHPGDAAQLGLMDGGRVRIVSRRGAAEARVEVTDDARPGHVALPNGLGLDVLQADGRVKRQGIALNELTDHRWRDSVVGTPWHKHVPVRLERVG